MQKQLRFAPKSKAKCSKTQCKVPQNAVQNTAKRKVKRYKTQGKTLQNAERNAANCKPKVKNSSSHRGDVIFIQHKYSGNKCELAAPKHGKFDEKCPFWDAKWAFWR